MTYLYVAAGGALGSVARHWMARVIDGRYGPAFPWGTVLVNITGSFAIGVLAALSLARTGPGLSESARLFLLVGVCGGFTTFSSFSLQTFALLQDGFVGRAAANVALSVVVCLLSTWAGFHLMAHLRTM